MNSLEPKNASRSYELSPQPRHHHSARRLRSRLDCTTLALPRTTAAATISSIVRIVTERYWSRTHTLVRARWGHHNHVWLLGERVCARGWAKKSLRPDDC